METRKKKHEMEIFTNCALYMDYLRIFCHSENQRRFIRNPFFRNN